MTFRLGTVRHQNRLRSNDTFDLGINHQRFQFGSVVSLTIFITTNSPLRKSSRGFKSPINSTLLHQPADEGRVSKFTANVENL